jgi:ABC-type polysaccharide/polyol phosphate export permease
MVHIDTFPPLLQAVAWCLPLTHLIAMVRPLMLEGTLPLTDFALHTSALVVFTLVCSVCAHQRLTRTILA